ncbi:MAG: hypothetical protein V4502_09790 [Pseudomonadota bacterium]
MSFESNEDFMGALTSLIHEWCERRRLSHLAKILPSYVGFNGLTDGWSDLRDGLKGAIGLGADSLTPGEWDVLQQLNRDADKALSSR